MLEEAEDLLDWMMLICTMTMETMMTTTIDRAVRRRNASRYRTSRAGEFVCLDAIPSRAPQHHSMPVFHGLRACLLSCLHANTAKKFS